MDSLTSDNKLPADTGPDRGIPSVSDPRMIDLEKQIVELSASPHFMPLMGSVRELLETERRRNRNRLLALVLAFTLVLGLFIWGPLYVVRSFVAQAESHLAAQRASLAKVEASLNQSATMLAQASRELRLELEARHPLETTPPTPPPLLVAPAATLRPTPVPAPTPAPTPAPAIVADPWDRPTSSAPPTMTNAAPPAREQVAKQVPAGVAAVTSAPPPTATAKTEAPLPPPSLVASATKPAKTSAVESVVSSTSQVARAGVPEPAKAPTAKVADLLDEVDKNILAVKRSRGASTNAPATSKHP